MLKSHLTDADIKGKGNQLSFDLYCIYCWQIHKHAVCPGGLYLYCQTLETYGLNSLIFILRRTTAEVVCVGIQTIAITI